MPKKKKSPYAGITYVLGDGREILTKETPTVSFSTILSDKENEAWRKALGSLGRTQQKKVQYRTEKDGKFISSVTWHDVKFKPPTIEETDDVIVIHVDGTYTKKPRIYRRKKK